MSHSGLRAWTTAAAVNGHSTGCPVYDRFTLKTEFSAIFDHGPAATDRMGSRRPALRDPKE